MDDDSRLGVIVLNLFLTNKKRPLCFTIFFKRLIDAISAKYINIECFLLCWGQNLLLGVIRVSIWGTKAIFGGISIWLLAMATLHRFGATHSSLTVLRIAVSFIIKLILPSVSIVWVSTAIAVSQRFTICIFLKKWEWKIWLNRCYFGCVCMCVLNKLEYDEQNKLEMLDLWNLATTKNQVFLIKLFLF